eukprot:11932030-Alexandrium_andersonii.AAC.1
MPALAPQQRAIFGRAADGSNIMGCSFTDSSGRLNMAAHGPSVLVELKEVAVDGQELHSGRTDGLELTMLNPMLEADAIIMCNCMESSRHHSQRLQPRAIH